ncbi:hypothetical protein M9Y10_046010 [Tritrichomonas musculus]|uniref:Uncharacterized protein n=1 Tax=Tritrichomonas musculus TaxID=1915356 RepID=A0ABR2JWY8_9EUKA
MEPMYFIPGKLKLKGKKKKKSAAAKEENVDADLEVTTGPYNRVEKIELKPITPTINKYDPSLIINELTDAELQALSIKNKSTKRLLEIVNSISFQEQKEKFNERLKSYPMHNDLEGD